MGSGSCTTLPDGSQDCGYALNFKPTASGARFALLNVSTVQGNSGTLMVSGTASAPVVAQLSFSTTLTRLGDGSLQAVVAIQNSGNGAAVNASLTGFTVGSAAGAPLPLSLGSIAAGGTVTATLNVPGSAGAAGAAVGGKIAGSYTGGTFGGSVRSEPTSQNRDMGHPPVTGRRCSVK